MGLQAEGCPRVGGRPFSEKHSYYSSKGTLIESAAKWTCPGSGRGAPKPFHHNESGHAGSAGVCELPRVASRTKTEILERIEADFCTPKNQQVAATERGGFWNEARCVRKCARGEKFCTQKSFFKETESSQVKGIPARAIRWLSFTHAPQASYQGVLHAVRRQCSRVNLSFYSPGLTVCLHLRSWIQAFSFTHAAISLSCLPDALVLPPTGCIPSERSPILVRMMPFR
jgi:hypothetical protein